MRALLVLAIAVALSPPLVASADAPPNRIQIARPEAHGAVDAHGVVGAGVRVAFPILRVGLLESAVDELGLSLGFDAGFYDFAKSEQDGDDLLLVPQAAIEWSFYPFDRASLFTELGFAVVIGDDDHFYHEETLDRDVHTDPLVSVGVRLHSGSRTAFVARVGWPVGVQLGVAF